MPIVLKRQILSCGNSPLLLPHDLKAPLRAIGSLAGFIEDEEMGKLKPNH